MADQKSAYGADFINEMKERLESEKERLERSLSKFAKRTPATDEEDYDTQFPEYGDDEDENAVEIADYTNNLSVEQDLEKELRDVNNALKRIADGSYGIDKYTGEPIGEARLRARPTSTSTVASKKTLTQEM